MKNRVMRGTLGVLLVAGVAMGVERALLLDEGFESAGALTQWTAEARLTDTEIRIAAPGQLSSNALLVTKHDLCGSLILSRSVTVPSGRWLCLTADVRLDHKLPQAAYQFMVTLHAGKTVKKPSLFFVFDDGLQKPTKFGGVGASPQTMGEWKTTEHLFQTDGDVDRLDLTLVFSGGAQAIRFDNIRLEDAGVEKPARADRGVFARLINWPYAELDVDMLTPGCTYEIEASVSYPPAPDALSVAATQASLLIERTPTNTIGMGVAMFTSDFRDKRSLRQALTEMPDRNGRKIYRLTVPQDAVTAHLDFHNDDLIRFEHYQIEALARRWQTVKIRLLDFGEVAADNQRWQYIYRGRPEALRPRDLVALSGFDIQALNAQLVRRKPVDAKVATIANGMCVLIDGKPVPPVMASALADMNAWHTDLYGELGRNGVNLVVVRYPYGGPPCHGDWTGPDTYDFQAVDEQIYRALKQNPDASLIFSVDDLVPPAWWGAERSHELLQDQDGRVCWSEGNFLYKRRYVAAAEMQNLKSAALKPASVSRMRGAQWQGTFIPSTASEEGRAVVSRFLVALRHHIESMPYGNAVIGYRLVWGYDGQWGAMGGIRDAQAQGDDAPHHVDFSAAMVARFQRYVREKYGTEKALRKAWNAPDMTFARISMPPLDHWHMDSTVPGTGYFLDPQCDQALIDYRECVNRTVGEQMLEWTAAIKGARQRQVLCLAYFPDISECCSGGPRPLRGHRQVMAAQGLDMGGGPSYVGREIGLDGMNNVMLNSFTLHGKMPLTEIDHRVFPVIKQNYNNNIIFDTPRKSISLLRREYMKQMCFGGGSWTLDMSGGWFSNPLIASVIGDARRVFAGVLEKDRGSIARMALFMGEQGKFIQADGLRGALPQTLGTFTKSLHPHSGVPVDEYHLWDLPLVAKQYNVFLFPFAYALTDEERHWIDALKRDGNLLVFGYGAGYVGHTLSVTNMEQVTGICFALDDRMPLTLKVIDRTHEITRELRGFLGSGGNASLEQAVPKIYVDDPQVVVLGAFVGDGQHAGLALKDHGTWQSLYVGGTGPFPPELLRGCARFKGLHVYTAGNDVLYACQSLIALHANSDGVKSIELPAEADVTSLWDGVPLGRVRQIVRPMRVGDNALYLLTPCGRLRPDMTSRPPMGPLGPG